MAWAGLTLTVSGRDALNQAQLSNQMNIKSVVVGDGFPPTNYGTAKGLVHQLYELTNLKVDAADGECIITADFPVVDYDYYFREIGVVVSTDEGDILYAYDNCGDDAQYIVGSTGAERTHKRIRLSLLISEVSDITVSSPNILYVAYDEYEKEIETLRQETVSKTGDTVSGNIAGSGGGVFAVDGNVYIKSQGYDGWLTNFLGQYGQARGTFQGDIDTLTNSYKNGSYWIAPTASGTKPYDYYFNLLVFNIEDTNTVQIAVSHKGNGVGVDTYVRSYINNVWSAWNRLLTQRDLSNHLGGQGIPVIQATADSGGLMEIGKYIDFHDAGSQADFDARLYYDLGKLISTAPIQASLLGNASSANRAALLESVNTSGMPYNDTYLVQSVFDKKGDNRFWLSILKNNTDSKTYEVGVDYAAKAMQDGNGNVIANTYLPRNGGRLSGEVIQDSYIVFGEAGGASFAYSNPKSMQLPWNTTGYGGHTIYEGLICSSNIDSGCIFYLARGGGCEHDFVTLDDKGISRGLVFIYDGKVVAPNGFQTQNGDYAEYWEWEDANQNAEDRTGLFTAFKGNKIRIARKGDPLVKVGVVSAAPSIIGDSDGKEWRNKYIKDIYGRDIWEDVEQEDGTVVKDRVLNPEYDETQKYVKRAERPEWDAIGTHGKLVVRDDGTCQPDGFCVPTDGGIATAADEGFYVMERLDESHIRIYMR